MIKIKKEATEDLQNLKPITIVKELDKYIIGQNDAKRSVAVALRNRWRRQQVEGDIKDEIAPKNIILIGPTGVGKTEISRRLAKLTNSPFFKVEASKFTEIGYVGRDVESMVRDLTEIALNNIKVKEQERVRKKAEKIAEERVLDILLPPLKKSDTKAAFPEEKSKETPGSNLRSELLAERKENAPEEHEDILKEPKTNQTREKLRRMLRSGKMDERYIDLDISEKPMPVVEIFSNVGMEELGINFKDMLNGMLPTNTKRRKVKVKDALKLLASEEAQRLVDMDKVVDIAIKRVEQSGIIFIDEIDKIVGKHFGHGPEVSREGVQRDLLPIVEGSTITTKYGMVKSDHILFIASGAFHTSKPADMIPELQGRFPIRVELESLGKNEFYRILTEPKNALILQYIALLRTEGVNLSFEDESVNKISTIAEDVNSRTENIGARRLHTLMERLLEDILFDAPDIKDKTVVINADYVDNKLQDIVKDEDLSRYIL